MGIFSRLISVKQESVRQKEPTVLFQQGFTQSKSFRGHKRFNVSYYGYKLAEDGIAQFRKSGSNLDGADILLRKCAYDHGWYVEVIVNGCLLGSVFDHTCNDEQMSVLEKLFRGQVESAHVHIEYETIFFTNKKGKVESTEREKIFLFLKAMD